MSKVDYRLVMRGEGWVVGCYGKEFGPFHSWVRAARLAICQARTAKRSAQIRVERRDGRCYVARVYS